ncbi:hypothetical protein GWK47_039013 [Chionoecetes opilio]|uniref:Uncharacterized protein n=1 Tax=Chionoecetes opilio TaxID=41210 RepID=A0A8J4YDI3_CHIOP|nr:hypothetical protein GWK47_039013 [Chionoecetes opilio]
MLTSSTPRLMWTFPPAVLPLSGKMPHLLLYHRGASRTQRLPEPPPTTLHFQPPPLPGPSTQPRHNVLPQLFTLLMEAFNLHQQGPTTDVGNRPPSPPHQHLRKGIIPVILDPPRLSLLSPPGLPTRYHPQNGSRHCPGSIFGDPAFSAVTVTTPLHGSDHLPLLASSLPSLPGLTPDACLVEIHSFRAGISSRRHFKTRRISPLFPWMKLPSPSPLSWKTLERLPSVPSTRRAPRRPGKSWWSEECAQAVKARRRAWNQWRRGPTLQLGLNTTGLMPYVPGPTLLAQRKAWGPHCASLSPSSTTKRTWDFFHSMEGTKRRLPLPLKDGANPLQDPPHRKLLCSLLSTMARLGSAPFYLIPYHPC